MKSDRQIASERRRRQKRALDIWRPLEVPTAVNLCWSLSFVSGASTDRRRFRILAVVDYFAWENFALGVAHSLSGSRVARELSSVYTT